MTPLQGMTTTVGSDTIRPVHDENPWHRLHRIADARRKHLHLTVEGLRGAGGPSAPWFYKLKDGSGPVSNRHVPYLNALDTALQWPVGTSVEVLETDPSSRPAAELEDRELELVEGQDEIGHTLFVIERLVRMMPPAERERVLREIARVAGLPVIGD